MKLQKQTRIFSKEKKRDDAIFTPWKKIKKEVKSKSKGNRFPDIWTNNVEGKKEPNKLTKWTTFSWKWILNYEANFIVCSELQS